MASFILLLRFGCLCLPVLFGQSLLKPSAAVDRYDDAATTESWPETGFDGTGFHCRLKSPQPQRTSMQLEICGKQPQTHSIEIIIN
jgi:hypothetical protein